MFKHVVCFDGVTGGASCVNCGLMDRHGRPPPPPRAPGDPNCPVNAVKVSSQPGHTKSLLTRSLNWTESLEPPDIQMSKCLFASTRNCDLGEEWPGVSTLRPLCFWLFACLFIWIKKKSPVLCNLQIVGRATDQQHVESGNRSIHDLQWIRDSTEALNIYIQP